MKHRFKCGRFDLDLGPNCRPLVMGILNVTPDSFSDGGKFDHLDRALSHAEEMLTAGVDIIDIGGESSRPGAPPVPLEQELARVMPVLYALRDCGKPISIDTYKPQVMRAALDAGADFINDIKGFRESTALAAVKESDCGLCIMHMQCDPTTMQRDPHYEHIVDEVAGFLLQRVQAMEGVGIERGRMCIDPGFGFGKTQEHNFRLLHELGIFKMLERPILVGLSRKSTVYKTLGTTADKALNGTTVMNTIALLNGASILRVHDVQEAKEAIAIVEAYKKASPVE